MTNWHTTSCSLCAQNCGLQVKIENNRIVKVRSETAQIANRPIAIRQGTDALLARAMISLIIQKGWEDKDSIE